MIMMNRPALVKLTNGLKRTAPNRILLLKKNTLVHHDGETPDENLKRSGISYHERIVLGYSSQQLCDIVADVSKYKEFVPFCTNSEILDDANLSSYTNIPTSTGNRFNLKAISRTDDLSNRRLGRYLNMTANKNQLRAPSTFSARLEIGYPPIIDGSSSLIFWTKNQIKKMKRALLIFMCHLNFIRCYILLYHRCLWKKFFTKW